METMYLRPVRCAILFHSSRTNCSDCLILLGLPTHHILDAFDRVQHRRTGYPQQKAHLLAYKNTIHVVVRACRMTRCSIFILRKGPLLFLKSETGRVKRIWYSSPMRAAKVQGSLRICAVSPEPPLLAHTSSESIGTFRQKARPLAPLNGWACTVKICHDGMLEDTNSLDAAQMQTGLRIWFDNAIFFAAQNSS